MLLANCVAVYVWLDALINYLSDIKSKFDRYKALVNELAEEQKKAIDISILGDEIRIKIILIS